MSTKVIVVGGGLAGLIASIRIARAGIPCLLIEKKNYPFHRVCGEYISNEALGFLQREGLFPESFSPPIISQFQLTSVKGKSSKLTLDVGGFGVSRYSYDHYIFELAKRSGVNVLVNTEVESIHFQDNQFSIKTPHKIYACEHVLGAFGKRSKLDAALQRSFMQKKSPYVGVKYHIRYQHPNDLIALHNFNGGYCGISNIENGKTNLCYLVHREQVRRYKTISQVESQVLHKNPHLKEIFLKAEFLFENPEVINEVSFETKEPVFNHILMMGDAAGMIAPLCGNGMAMAIHSGKLASDILIQAIQENLNRHWVEKMYAAKWQETFSKRLWLGRIIQNYLFGSEWSSNLALAIALHVKPLTNLIIRNTHGKSF